MSLLCISQAHAQTNGISINTTGNPPDSSAILDIVSSNKGLLIPRVNLTSTADCSTIVKPAESIMIYNLSATADVTPGYYYWTGSKWARFGWQLGGNRSTDPSVDFLGTSDTSGFAIRTDSIERLRITGNGKIGILTTNPEYDLDVAGTIHADQFNVNGAYTLPATAGNNGQIMTTNGSAVFWANAPAMGGGTLDTGNLWIDAGDYLYPSSYIGNNIQIADTQNYTYGFYANMNSGANQGFGGYFASTGTDGDLYGVYGSATYTGNSDTGFNYGGYLTSKSNSRQNKGLLVFSNQIGKGANGQHNWGIDVGALSDGNSGLWGIYNFAGRGPNGFGDVYGIVTIAHSINGGNTNYGIYATAIGGATNWAGYFDGDAYISGKVGIGTNNPQTTLHVQGTTYLNGNVGIGTNVPLAKLHVIGKTYINGFLGIGTSDPANDLDVVGYASISAGVGIGTTSPQKMLDVIGDTYISGKVGIGTLNPVTQLHVVGNAYVNGNVGIGTSNPAAPLSVGASSQFKVNSSGAITAATGITSSGTITFSSMTTAGFVKNNINGQLNGGNAIAYSDLPAEAQCWKRNSSGSVYPASVSDIVGIGTNNPPQGKLWIEGGDIWISGYNAKLSFSTDNTTDAIPNVSILASNNDLLFRTYNGLNPVENMRITSNGRVGIGTNAPGGKLQVNNTDGSYLVYSTDGNLSAWHAGTATGEMRMGAYGSRKGLYSDNDMNILATSGLALSGRGNNYTDLYINNSGRVGIGTTSPVSNLDIEASAFNLKGHLIVNRTNSGGLGGELTIRNAATYSAAGTAASIAFELDNTDSYNADGSNASNAEIRGIVTSGTNQATDLQFSNWSGTNQNINMIIKSDGKVGIGTTTPGTYKLYINGSGWIASAWTVSDISLKTDIKPLENAIELVKKLKPVRYEWKKGLEKYGIDMGGKKDIGFIAQDVQQVLPEIVREGVVENQLAINYDHISAVNTAAIQELIYEIEKLKKENEIIKTDNEKMKQAIEKLGAKVE